MHCHDQEAFITTFEIEFGFAGTRGTDAWPVQNVNPNRCEILRHQGVIQERQIWVRVK